MSSLRLRVKAKAKAKPPRTWGASLIRGSRAHFLGFVEATDAKAAVWGRPLPDIASLIPPTELPEGLGPRSVLLEFGSRRRGAVCIYPPPRPFANPAEGKGGRVV